MKEPTHTQVLFPGHSPISVPGVNFIKTLPGGVTHLKASETGTILMVVPPTAVVITNWDKPDHS